jgi:putrescine aminotransferase
MGMGAERQQALWHGFADMGAVAKNGEFVIARGDGAQIWDSAGRRYLDATAGLWFTNVGHGRTQIADAVAEQIGRIAAYSTFGDYAVDTTVALADRLAAIAPVPGSKIFFTSGGSDSVDTAVKLARRYWRETGHPTKDIVIGREKAYHGMHVAGTALAGIPGNHDGYGELMTDARTIAWNSGKALLEAVERIGADNIAAFFCEPIIGAGGIYPPPAGYLAEVRQICRDNDILFVADEVITGFGRIGGAWFASTKFGLEPDMVTTAKGLTSGYVPMGAVFVAPRVAEPFFDPAAGVWWRHGYTYGGHAAAAAAAMANLDIIESEDLLTASARLETTLHSKLAGLADHPSVAEVRSGFGAVAAVQLVDAGAALGLAKKVRGHGIATRAVGAGGIQISPAFVITDAQIDELVAGITAALG